MHKYIRNIKMHIFLLEKHPIIIGKIQSIDNSLSKCCILIFYKLDISKL
jgi:hypothetical protein